MFTSQCGEPPKRELEPCGCLPPGFFRLRYFFGKHLGVADFIDEQRYHAGKQRFHNQRLHGAGVLCGLRISLLEAGGTIVRVGKGAALDRCGREVIVGFDQCIDVGAWYEAERARRNEDDPAWPADLLDEDGRLRLCVVLRYAECPTRPEPAPRDPCSCAEGGCEFGRVSEEFELKLMPESEALSVTVRESFPASERLAEALEGVGGLDLLGSLTEPILEGCPLAAEETWLLLGCFGAVLEDAERKTVVGIEEVTASSQILLSTEALQTLVSGLYAASGVDLLGPAIIGVGWEKVSAAPETYRAVLWLSSEIEAGTVDSGDGFALRKLTAAGWDPPGADAVTSVYDEALGPALHVSMDNSAGYLAQGERYQLYVSPSAGPIVDSELRHLKPRSFVLSFRLGLAPGTGDLTLELPPFGP